MIDQRFGDLPSIVMTRLSDVMAPEDHGDLVPRTWRIAPSSDEDFDRRDDRRRLPGD